MAETFPSNLVNSFEIQHIFYITWFAQSYSIDRYRREVKKSTEKKMMKIDQIRDEEFETGILRFSKWFFHH